MHAIARLYATLGGQTAAKFQHSHYGRGRFDRVG
jgi:hypothetical protein